MRVPSISALVLALVSAHASLSAAVGQAPGENDCWLEQRLSPWRPTCLTPLHLAATTQGVVRPAGDGPALAAALSLFGRSAFASDRDNGGVWAGRGLSMEMAFGFGGSLGPVRYSFFPSVQWAQNLDFAVADTVVAGYSPYAYPWEGPGIDSPQRMGTAASHGLGTGQSYLEIAGWWNATLGVSTENIWWGPSKRYPMLLGATSGGFPHAFGRSPTVTFAGLRMVTRAVFGRLTESDHFDHNENNDRNLLSVLRLEVGLDRPSGALLTITSMVRQQWDSGLGLGDVIGLLIPRSTTQEGVRETLADGIGAVTLVLPLESIDMKIHGTWGRGDFFLDTEDLLTEPEHNQFWSVGLLQRWQPIDSGPRWSLSLEHASTAASPSQVGPYRNPTSLTVYRHGSTRQGHSQRGQLLGPSIGPGTRATFASLGRAWDDRDLAVLVERILWDIDALRRSLPDGSRGNQDREWLFGGRLGVGLDIEGVAHLRLDAFGGTSIRRNRQYIRFTGDLGDYPERETNFWLDVRVSWTPGQGDAFQ